MTRRHAITSAPRPMTIEERADAIADHAAPGREARGKLRQERVRAEAMKMLREMEQAAYALGLGTKKSRKAVTVSAAMLAAGRESFRLWDREMGDVSAMVEAVYRAMQAERSAGQNPSGSCT